jgi:hypothetical protein
MKEKRTYKILRIDGIGIEPNSNHNVKYLGKSRIDDYPLFEVEYDPKNSALSVDILRASLKVSGNPGYVIKYSEIRIIERLGDNLIGVEALLPNPTRVYAQLVSHTQWDTGCDERLLLMM